jgi:hypothetical protein
MQTLFNIEGKHSMVALKPTVKKLFEYQNVIKPFLPVKNFTKTLFNCSVISPDSEISGNGDENSADQLTHIGNVLNNNWACNNLNVALWHVCEYLDFL